MKDLDEALRKIAELETANVELTTKLAKESADKQDALSNFEKYRKGHSVPNEDYEAATKERDTYKSEFDTYKTSTEKQNAERRTKFMDDKRKEFSKGDPKIAAAIDAEYAILNLPDGTEEEIQARMEKARAIVQGSGSAPSIHDAAGGNSPAGDKGGNPDAPLSADAQGLL